MSINQEFISRLEVATIAIATATNFRAGETTTISETGTTYQCNTVGGDITLTNGLFLKPVNHVLRGSGEYPSYQAGRTYNVGDKVFHEASGLYYRCIKAATTSDAFSTEFFQELSLESGFAIADASTAFAGTHEADFSHSIKVVGDLNSLVNGTTLTETQANQIAGSFGVGAYFNTQDGRVLPRYSFQNNTYGIYGGTVDDPTAPSAMVDLIIPSTFLHRGQRIILGKVQASASGQKRTYVYQGNPISGGIALDPVIGTRDSGATENISVYEITDSSVDLHILLENELVINMQLEDYVAELHTYTHLASSIQDLGLISGYSHGDTLTAWDSSLILSSLGVKANFKADAGRVLPQYADTWGFGFIGGTAADPTVPNSAVVEMVLPKEQLDPNMEVLVHRSAVSASGNRYVRAYSGDPQAGGVEITPNTGTNEQLTSDSAVVGFLVGSGNIEVPNDIHVVFAGQYVKEVVINTFVPNAAFDETPIDAVRGSAPYADYQETGTSYAVGDKVFNSVDKLNYKALEAITADAGVFDPTKWREMSVEALDEASDTTQIDALRGGVQYANYAATGVGYSVDDKVFEPVSGKNYKALEEILAPAGAFDTTKWQELSIESADREITAAFIEVVGQIEQLRGAADYNDFDDTLNYVVGNKVSYLTKSYICIQATPTPAGTFDPLDWREMSVEELDRAVNADKIEVDAVRGAFPYPAYAPTGTAYSIGDKIIEITSRKNYKALEAIASDAGTFDLTKWQEISTQLNEERLDTLETTVEGIDDTYKTLQTKVAEIATEAGSAHGGAFTYPQVNEFIRAIGIPAWFPKQTGRPFPLFYDSNNEVGFFGGQSSVDLIPDSGCMLIVIPQASCTQSQELRVTTTSSSGGGNRFIAAYSGADLTTPLPLTRGSLTNNSTTNTHTRFFDIPTGTGDIYLYSSRQVIFDIALPNKSARYGAVLAGTKLAPAVSYLQATTNYVHTDTLSEADANSALLGLGLNATWSVINGRSLPQVWDSTSKVGVYGGSATTDETLDGDALEIIIPKQNLQHDMTLDILRSAVSASGSNRRTVAYSGDPKTTGTKLTPTRGQEVSQSLNVSSVSWNVSTTPDAINEVSEDLHILVMGQSIFGLDLFKTKEADAVDIEAVVEPIRGATPRADFSTTSSYSIGDFVHRPTEKRDYKALVAVTAGNWDATQWERVSVQDNNAKIDGVVSTVSRNFGGDLPADHNTTTNYTKDDFVYRPTEDKSYQCIVTSVTGAFQSQFWKEVNIKQSATRLLTVEDEAVSLQDQVDVLRGSSVYPDYDPARPTVYAKGSIVHEPTNGKNFRATVEIPANAGAFDGIGWDEMSVQANNDPLQIARRLEELSGDDRISPSAINLLTYHQTVYVSNSGDDANDGRSPENPVATLVRAKAITALLPMTSKVLIECQDASVFNEVYSAVGTQVIDLYMPTATLIGDLDVATLGRVETKIGTVMGDIYINAFNHHSIGQIDGDIIINDTSAGAASITAKDLIAVGAIEVGAANGDVYFGIEHVHAGFIMPTWLPSQTVHGFIGVDTLETAEQIRDKLNTLVEVERLPVDSVDGAADMYSRITQVGHGFTQLAPVSFDGTTWVLADNTNADTCIEGIVCSVTNADNFRVLFGGKEKMMGHGLTVGEYYWLGAAGALEINQPTSNIIQQALFVLDTDTVLVEIGQAFSI